jgi:membrane-associated phospholipid phosphatase
VPHSALLYLLLRRRERFERAAVLTYATFDIGAGLYWIVPTAPPWYAAEQGRITPKEGALPMRRLMYEHGEAFWRGNWRPLYDFLGGNPLAAMPSLHFATSVMVAHLLAEAGAVEGAVGWSYALALGFALVYLGEHYVADLLAGLALAETVRLQGPRAAPLLSRVAGGIQALEARARA